MKVLIKFNVKCRSQSKGKEEKLNKLKNYYYSERKMKNRP